MPTYYGDDIGDDEMVALVSYLKTMRDPTHMPVEGKFGSQWTWWDDKDIVAEGQQVFEGLHPATEGLNCAVCHGKDGVSRNPEAPNLAGMSSLYLEKSLVDYRKGIRQDRRMSLIASALSMEQIKDLAAWYSAFEISVKVPEID